MEKMDQQAKKRRKIKNLHQTDRSSVGYAFIAPQILLMFVFIVYPVIKGFTMSFYEVYGLDTYFVGLNNFIQLFTDPIFMKSIINTLFFCACNCFFNYSIFVICCNDCL